MLRIWAGIVLSAGVLAACAHDATYDMLPHLRAGVAPNSDFDCNRQAEAPPLSGWTPNAVFVPRGRPCNILNYTIAAGENGDLRNVYQSDKIYAPVGAGSEPRRRSESYSTQQGDWDRHFSNVIDNLTRFAETHPDEPLKIIIFAHGGMVSHQSAVQRAEENASWMIRDGYFPIFFIWNSDLGTAYGDHLCCVNQGEPSSIATAFFAPARLIGDLMDGVAHSLEHYGAQQLRFNDSVAHRSGTRYYLCNPPKAGAASDADVCVDRKHVTGPNTASSNVIYPSVEDVAMNDPGEQPLQRRFSYAALLPARGVTTTFAGVGENAWNNMVRRTRISFTSVEDAPSSVTSVPCLGDTFERTLNGAYGRFLERLQCELGANEKLKTRDVRITFVGHSMGAIVGDEMAREFPCLPYDRFVYMGAATTIRSFRDTTLRLVQRDGVVCNGAVRAPISFNNLMLHPLAESRELSKAGFVLPKGSLPQGSLLEWVDEMLQRSRSVDERTLGKWVNVARAKRLFPDDSQMRMTFRIFPAQFRSTGAAACELHDGEGGSVRRSQKPVTRCYPRSHGEFDRYSFWRRSYWLGEFAEAPPAATEAP